MQTYDDFVREAIEQYDELPQETGELYKRHYINIPFDVKSFQNNVDSQTDGKSDETWIGTLGVKFDAIIRSGDFLMEKPGEFLKIERAGNPNGSDGSGLYTSMEDKYVSYINAYSDKNIIIEIPDGKSASINILMLNSNRPLSAKILISLGKESKLNLFEYYGSCADKQTALGVIHEINLGDNSKLELDALHNENSNTLCLGFCKNRIGDNSHFIYNSVYVGSAHSRVRNVIEADHNESKVEVNEIIFGSGTQKFDIGTQIVNSAPHTNASLESKAALMDSSFCILKGFAKIKRGATKAKSYVHERGILLDSGAKVYGLPDMSVDENDVKATHSSATSPVDPESVFYLMSKGIDEIGVRKLLVTGFFVESLSKIHSSVMKSLSMSLINTKLDNKSYGGIPKLDARNMWVGASDSADADMFKGHYKYRGAE